MENVDFDYIGENVANISNIPVRVYHAGSLSSTHSKLSIPVDPCTPYLEKLLLIYKKVSYFVTPYYQFYGVIHHEDHTLIIGPTYQLQPTRGQIREFMFELGIREDYYKHYTEFLKEIPSMPLETFSHFLCFLYYSISGEKIDISNVLLYDSFSKILIQNQQAEAEKSAEKEVPKISGGGHDTYYFETQMLSCVTAGDMERLLSLFQRNSAGQAGKMSSNYLRHIKNVFITTASLVSRAAIAGGLPYDYALSLTDRYIQHSESYSDPEQIMNLQYHMVLDFVSQVHDFTNGAPYNEFLRTTTRYVYDHITEDITVEQMAKDLYLSRSHLSTKFKEECGMNLRDYIQRAKIKKAQDYLKNTTRSILDISTHLGFSSQGYFQNVFKKWVGTTPKKYREE